VLTAPCYVIADTHIGVVPTEVDRALLAWLDARLDEARRGPPPSLLINGDLFEFWFEWRTVIPRPAFRILASLAALHDAGVPILWIAGNHDCWGGDVVRRDVGAVYHVGPWTGAIAGWRARVEHGDGLRQHEDRRYRALRSVLRNPLAVRAFRWLPPDLATRIAFWSSQTSRTTRARDGGAGLRRVALDYLTGADAPELVILGHSHVETLERGPGGGIYANAGSWLNDPTFLRVVPDRIELRRWNGSGQDTVVEVMERSPDSKRQPPAAKESA
jgi:UDP-2,3-diacylglucosamine hydrolase